jgi:type IV secretion system protein VirB4
MNPVLDLIAKTLLKRSKKDPKSLLAKNIDEDFIPYVCHFDPNTILTKNGELLQIIRITGFSNAGVISEIISLRETVREAILDHVQDTNFAFWFTTIRRKKNITPKGEFSDFLSSEVNEIWIHENNLDDQYVNELYITVIIEGIDTSIVNLKSFLRSFSYSSIKSLHHEFLTSAHKTLTDLTSKILGEVEDYGGKLIGIKEWDGVLYSEPMRFFGKIINLYEDRYPLACNDISNEISTHKIAFGDRELQVLGNKNKNFAAVFSLKEYFEVSTESLDKILQLPLEFIITQSFDFSFSITSCKFLEMKNSAKPAALLILWKIKKA